MVGLPVVQMLVAACAAIDQGPAQSGGLPERGNFVSLKVEHHGPCLIARRRLYASNAKQGLPTSRDELPSFTNRAVLGTLSSPSVFRNLREETLGKFEKREKKPFSGANSRVNPWF
ncbi:MAG: hypothetical protein JOY60_02825 [Burkholderiaceae bacterium]|nr:hypothetical protein [Burkholderiaceae bacterium]